MVTNAELLKIPAFVDLPDDQISWFISNSKELDVKSGDVVFRQDDTSDAMFIIVDGVLQARGELGGETVVFPLQSGSVTGLLPFSRMKQYTVGLKVLSDSKILRYESARFPELVQKMPELTQRLVGLMSDRIRETTRREQQRDRLASLGKLSAGLAHELNNPASAAKRATSQLREVLTKIRDASHELGSRDLTAAQRAEIEKLETAFVQMNEPPPEPLALSDLEEQIDSLLRSHGQSDLWQLAADLARKGVKPAELESLFATLDAGTARAALVRIAASVCASVTAQGRCSGPARPSTMDRNRSGHGSRIQPAFRTMELLRSI